jgi:hypothetical protein
MIAAAYPTAAFFQATILTVIRRFTLFTIFWQTTTVRAFDPHDVNLPRKNDHLSICINKMILDSFPGLNPTVCFVFQVIKQLHRMPIVPFL